MTLFLVFLTFACCYSQNSNDDDQAYSNLRGKYFGQQSPGLTPVKFEPFGTGKGGEFIFSKDGERCVFIREFKLYYTEMLNNRWLEPEKVKFSNCENRGIFGIGITQNWDKLYFNSLKPVLDEARAPVWVAKINNNAEWNEPRYLGFGGMYISIAGNGNLYFTTWSGGGAQIGRSLFQNVEYQKPEILPAPIRSEYEDMHPCVSPDEKFILFDSEDRPRVNESTLYISFFRDEKWTKPLHLGKYITQENASMAMLSFDGKYLFFNDAGGDYYWISTKIIDQL